MSSNSHITPRVFDQIFRKTLSTLVEDLALHTYYARERDVINLFVFAHLAPEFRNEGLDLTLIAIECPVLQSGNHSTKARLGIYGDVVIWRKPYDSRFRGVKPEKVKHPFNFNYLRKNGCKPMAVLAWKNISEHMALPTRKKTASRS
jgi:hypothetical protein